VVVRDKENTVPLPERRNFQGWSNSGENAIFRADPPTPAPGIGAHRMRALKTILIILGALLGVVVLLSFFGKKDFRFERSITIKAPAEAVYNNISSLAAMDKWGPWKEMEHNMTSTLSGSPDGQIGAISHWKSDESEGEMELAELTPNSKVRTKLRFISPWAANNEGTYDLEAMGDSTRITWGMQGQNGFVSRVVSVFMNMDAMLAPMFDKGLSDLKSLTEKEYALSGAASAGAYQITVTDRPAMLYVGKREVVKWADMKEFFGKNFGAGFAAIGKLGVTPAGAPSGVYFAWNEKDQSADLIAGVPVAVDAKDKLKGMDVFEAPASKAYVIDYVGGYNGIGKAHEAMDARIKADGVQMNQVVIEEYITDPGQEPDSTKWHTNVVYLVK
jgi:effector-binding domain-containing protein